MRQTLHVRGSREEVRRALAALPALLSGRTADPTGRVRALQLRLGQVLLALVRDAYVAKAAGGTDDAGQRWAPLKDSTIRGRRRGRGKGAPLILRDTGRLLSSLGPGAIETRPGEVVIGTNVHYARYLHEGTKRMVARRLWPEPEQWPAAWWAEIGEQLREGIVEVVKALLGGRAA